MCGICGISRNSGEEDGANVRRMMATLAHRGPDGMGQHTDDYCSLGHRRLAILDLSDKGMQPMCNENQTVWSVVNGEIYNYKDLRRQLKSWGHIFTSECDSEVVTHAYEEFGDDFASRLRGMFALAVYDSTEKKIILARDPIGKKPLYYAWLQDKLIFASEIKALFEAGVAKEVNYEAIPSWLLYQYSIGRETLFKGVYKLPTGCILVDQEKKPWVIFSYWSLPRESYIADGIQGAVRLRETLEESVKLRLQSDVPIGAFLSGGIDSSAVTALYRKFYTGKLHTFTATFDGHSEAEYAKKVSDYLDTEYHEVMITAEMVAQDLEKVTWHHDEPLGDAAVLCNYYLAKEAKKFVTVVLAGEGGDELFGGYPWHKFAGMIGAINRVPAPLRKLAAHTIGAMGSDVTSRLYGLHRMLALADHDSLDEALLYPTTAASKGNLRWLLKDSDRLPGRGRSTRVRGTYNRMLALDTLNLLPEKFLMKADKGTMAWGIEERLPLLDQKVIELAFRIDPDLKKNKWILRKAVSDLLPMEIVKRPKQGFGTPVRSWLGSEPLRSQVLDRLCNGELLKEVCRGKSLDKLVWELHKKNNGRGAVALDSAGVIWGLFALQIWYDTWFNNGG